MGQKYCVPIRGDGLVQRSRSFNGNGALDAEARSEILSSMEL